MGDRIDRIASNLRSESFDLGYFDAQDDRHRERPFDNGADRGTSAEYQRGYQIGYSGD